MRVAALSIAVLSLTVVAPIARAANPVCQVLHDHYAGGSARIQRLDIDNRSVTVLLPPGYALTRTRYPVVYLLHGSSGNPDNYLVQSDLVAFTGDQPVTQQAIVVLPDGGQLPAWTDAPGSERSDESFFVHTLIPAIDGRYRTRTEGRHRAVAGFSLGGGAAFHLVARHPELFAAAASFSGADDFDPDTSPRIALFVAGAGSYDSACAGDPQAVNRLGPIADLGTHSLSYHNASPTDLASNLKNHAVALFAGDGVPCPGDSPQAAALVALEADDHAASGRFANALRAAHVPHTYDDYGCGTHSYKYVERDLHAWWPSMSAAMGAPAPSVFDYRTADPQASFWGWSVHADPRRAGEFLDLRAVSRYGLALVGSGRTTLTTPPLFAPHQKVLLTGATSPVAVADRSGRLALTVDLGPPHTAEQYTAEGRLAATRHDYFTERQVSFRPAGK